MKKLKDTHAVSGTVQSDFREGNSKTSDFKLSAYGLFNFDQIQHIFVIQGKYGKSGGIENANQSMIHYRLVVEPFQRVSREHFLQTEADEFTRLQRRNLLGVGWRYRLLASDTTRLFWGAGAFYVTEKLRESANISEKVNSSFGRFNFYYSWTYNLNKDIAFLSVTYFQPKVELLRDFRLLSENSLEFKVYQWLSISLVYNQTQDNMPPIGVQKVDRQYGTVWKFNY